MAIVIGGILTLLSIGVVVYPFLKSARARRATPEYVDSPVNLPPQRLDVVYQTIRTLHLEHELGRISDENYRTQLDAYRIEAAEILRDLDQGQASNGHENAKIDAGPKRGNLSQGMNSPIPLAPDPEE